MTRAQTAEYTEGRRHLKPTPEALASGVGSFVLHIYITKYNKAVNSTPSPPTIQQLFVPASISTKTEDQGVTSVRYIAQMLVQPELSSNVDNKLEFIRDLF